MFTDEPLVSLSSFLMTSDKFETKEERDNCHRLLNAIGRSCKVVANAVRRAGIDKMFGDAGITNVQGEKVKKLDIVANSAWIRSLSNTGLVAAMISEEDGEVLAVEEEYAGDYIVCFDPLDGSSNIDANVSVGSIFGVFKKKSKGPVAPEDYLRPGSELYISGYALYGSCTMLVFSVGKGAVHGFTLDNTLGEFLLTHPTMRVKPKGSVYSINSGRSLHWDEPTTKAIAYFQSASSTKKPYSHRYVGSMVADVHRTLLYGGIFAYPADKALKNGKLRYLYEVAPLSVLITRAGGASITGAAPALDYVPKGHHDRLSVWMGSKKDVKVVYELFMAKKEK